MKNFTRFHRFIVNLTTEQERMVNLYLNQFSAFHNTAKFIHMNTPNIEITEKLLVDLEMKNRDHGNGVSDINEEQLYRIAERVVTHYTKCVNHGTDTKGFKNFKRMKFDRYFPDRESTTFNAADYTIDDQILGKLHIWEPQWDEFLDLMKHMTNTVAIELVQFNKKYDLYCIDVTILTNEYDGIASSVKTEGVGIDVGVDIMFAVSDGSIYPNITDEPAFINRRKKMMTLYERIRDLSNAIDEDPSNVKVNKWREKSYNNQREIMLLELQNSIALTSYFDDVVNKICVKNPKFIVIETLNNFSGVGGLPEVRVMHIEYFTNILKNKLKDLDIPLFTAPVTYPSSKRCANCGSKDVQLVGRKMKCRKCKTTWNRDLNASLNLKEYGESIYNEALVDTLEKISRAKTKKSVAA